MLVLCIVLTLSTSAIIVASRGNFHVVVVVVFIKGYKRWVKPKGKIGEKGKGLT